MDRITPAPSFRPTRSVTRSRNRTRPMSPSPRPNLRRPFAEPVPSTLFITTDYDYISPSSPDPDLIFNMSPIHSHFFPSSPSEPVNVMTLRNKTQRSTNSPPLSPLLYSFPRPSRLHPFTKQSATSPKDIPSKPLSSISQNLGVPAPDYHVRPVSSLCGAEAEPAGEVRPLAASLFDSSLPAIQNQKPKTITTSSPSHSSHQIYSSSPIPIPRHMPRQSDPGPFVPQSPLPVPVDFSPNFNDTPLPSSGIASHMAIVGFRSTGSPTSPAGSSASPEPLRIEGFDGLESDPPETDQEKSAESLIDFCSPAVSSTAYSYSGSGPFRFSMFLGIKGESSNSSSEVSEKSAFFTPKRSAGQRGDGHLYQT